MSGFLFGFLLNISINTPKGFGPVDSIVLMIPHFAITLAVSLFAMPVVYHHLQYPHRDLQKFKLRSHKFVKFGIVPAAITLYLGLELGLELGLKLGFPSMNFDYLGFVIAGVPFAFIYIFLRQKVEKDVCFRSFIKNSCDHCYVGSEDDKKEVRKIISDRTNLVKQRANIVL